MLSLKQIKNFDRYGCVEIDENNLVTRFTEKGYRDIGNINGGVYLASADIFRGFDLERVFSFEEFIQNQIKSLRITSQVYDNYFIDIGIPEDYEIAQRELKDLI